jgi:hypothetical protein
MSDSEIAREFKEAKKLEPLVKNRRLAEETNKIHYPALYHLFRLNDDQLRKFSHLENESSDESRNEDNTKNDSENGIQIQSDSDSNSSNDISDLVDSQSPFRAPSNVLLALKQKGLKVRRWIYGDGNCFHRVLSFFFYQTENRYKKFFGKF